MRLRLPSTVAAVILCLAAPAAALAAPPNDPFSAAQPVTTAPATVPGTIKDATREPGEPSHGILGEGHSVWYRLTLPVNGTVTVDTCAGPTDTVLSVYTGAAVGALTPIAAGDDGELCGGPGQRVRFVARAGASYMIAVDGDPFEDEGPFVMRIAYQGPPANDAFAGAQLLPGHGAQVRGDTRTAGRETGEPLHAGVAGGASLWYRWRAPASGYATVDACKSGFDTLLGVYTGEAVGALRHVASNDDSPACRRGRSRLSFLARRGTVYSIAIDGKGTAAGRVSLHVGLPMAGTYSGKTEDDGMRFSFRLRPDGTRVDRITINQDLDCQFRGVPVGEVRLRRVMLADPIPLRPDGTWSRTIRARGGAGTLTVAISGRLDASDRARGKLEVTIRQSGIVCRQIGGPQAWSARRQ